MKVFCNYHLLLKPRVKQFKRMDGCQKKTTEIASEFFLSDCTDASQKQSISSSSKMLNAGREKMWSTYYKIRISPTFRRTWCDFFVQAIGSIPPPHLYKQICTICNRKLHPSCQKFDNLETNKRHAVQGCRRPARPIRPTFQAGPSGLIFRPGFRLGHHSHALCISET